MCTSYVSFEHNCWAIHVDIKFFSTKTLWLFHYMQRNLLAYSITVIFLYHSFWIGQQILLYIQLFYNFSLKIKLTMQNWNLWMVCSRDALCSFCVVTAAINGWKLQLWTRSVIVSLRICSTYDLSKTFIGQSFCFQQFKSLKTWMQTLTAIFLYIKATKVFRLPKMKTMTVFTKFWGLKG